MIEKWRRARKKSVPIVAISTPDEFETARMLVKEESPNGNGDGEKKEPVPFIVWDICQGLRGGNKLGDEALRTLLEENEMSPAAVSRFPSALELAQEFPGRTVLIVHGAHRLVSDYLDDPYKAMNVQAVLNLRDLYKQDKRTCVLLGPMLSLPPELASDVLPIEQPLPDKGELAELVTDIYESTIQSHPEFGLSVPNGRSMEEIVDSVNGLAFFSAEQVLSLSMEKTGVDVPMAWQRKIQVINSTPGLSVDASGKTLKDVGGLRGIIPFGERLMSPDNPLAPGATIWVDEIEKGLAGASGLATDSSGVSQDILGALLSWMQEEEATGLIAVGPPGTGKSLCAKVLGAVGNRLTIRLDIGGMKSKFVGESEQNVRNALRIVKSLAGSRTFWIATSNGIAALPPELKRRFKYGIWYFDLPDEEEREVIWSIYLRKFDLPMDIERPDDEGWTGSEIETSCMIASSFRCTPKEAAEYITPVCDTAAAVIKSLRKEAAEKKYRSASYPGPYVPYAEARKAKRTRQLGWED